MISEVIKLSQELIKYPSITKTDGGIIQFIKKYIDDLGFESDILNFSGDNSYPVINLHTLYNPYKSSDIFYFAGHTDVVGIGDEKLWSFPPFAAKIIDGNLYGRGAVDMKCAIASFIVAAAEFIAENKKLNFGIGLLITGDEEDEAVNGTRKMLGWMKDNNKIISACLVGEPTNPNKIGEMIKIGRRGSVNFNLTIIGKQGHVAYPENADNPITTLINVLKILKDRKLDEGNSFFDPSNLEITWIDSQNIASNVIPKEAKANFNIRFNNEHDSKSLISLVEHACKLAAYKYHLTYKVSGESFITKPGFLSDIATKAVWEKTGFKPELSTTGGTSDARFIKDLCPVVEFGLINQTAHQIDEMAAVDDIKLLKEIYKKMLELYSQKS